MMCPYLFLSFLSWVFASYYIDLLIGLSLPELLHSCLLHSSSQCASPVTDLPPSRTSHDSLMLSLCHLKSFQACLILTDLCSNHTLLLTVPVHPSAHHSISLLLLFQHPKCCLILLFCFSFCFSFSEFCPV
jgi:hypothetical protein